MEFESACNAICDNISHMLLAMDRPSSTAAFAAARATRDIADALHHAAGRPHDGRWNNAIGSLERFLGVCPPSALRESVASRELLAFLAEN